MGPKSYRLSDEDHRIVSQVNTLLEQLNVATRISLVEDLTAAVYVLLFEGLCGEQLEGIIRNPITKEDEIENCQIVIDTLANDVLHTSLNHISGRCVVECDRESIVHMMEIFAGLLEYILNRIESDVSTDNDDEEEKDITLEDPDILQSDVIDKILERELGKSPAKPTAVTNKHTRKTNMSSVYWEDSMEKPRMQNGTLTDSKGYQGHESYSGQEETTTRSNKGDSTSDLIHQSEILDSEHPKTTYDYEEEFLKSRPVLRALVNSQPMSTSSQHRENSAGRLAGVMDNYRELARIKYSSEDRTPHPSDRMTESYENLNHIVEETAAMAREAVGASPNRAKTILQSLDSSYNREAASHRTSPSGVYGTRRLQQSLPMYVEDELSSDNDLTPTKSRRKVSFMVDRSTSDSSPSYLKDTSLSKPKTAWEERPKSSKSMLPSKVGSQVTRKNASSKKLTDHHNEGSKMSRPVRPCQENFGSFLDGIDFEDEKENSAYDRYLKKQFQEIVDEVLSDDEVLPPKYKSRSDQRRIKPDKLPSKSQGTYTVKDTQKLMEKERKFGKNKIEFLSKIYQEDLDELKLESNHELKKERASAKETEKDYKKNILTAPKASKPKAKSGLIKKKPSPKLPVSTKAKKRSTNGLTPVAKPKFTIKDDDDILPMLLKEFPHLHLSLHTWHELWRKGINQIEQVTRANQEVRRKKSHARAELEEAEKRQEIMVNIMRKELEHQQRLKEVKERKSQSVVARNRMHEKRIQSARSRKYYDEYQVRMRAKMLKRRTREEMIFRKLFKDGLEIQKERVKDLRKYAKEQRESQAKLQRNEVESMENHYRDQFEMLAESISKERKEMLIREKAQQKVLDGMKRDLRKKMENEIKDLQQQLNRDDDDAYFRQLDADRVIHDLQMAKYHVNV